MYTQTYRFLFTRLFKVILCLFLLQAYKSCTFVCTCAYLASMVLLSIKNIYLYMCIFLVSIVNSPENLQSGILREHLYCLQPDLGVKVINLNCNGISIIRCIIHCSSVIINLIIILPIFSKILFYQSLRSSSHPKTISS